MCKVSAVVMLAFVLGVAVVGVSPGLAAKNGPPVREGVIVPVNETWEGISYPELTERWWHWALEQEDGILPGLTPNGQQEAKQSGSVWFLAGTFTGKPATLDITIPSGKAIFFPLFNQSYIGFPWDPNDTPELAWSIITPEVDAVHPSTLKCILDNVPMGNLASYRVVAKGCPDEWSFELLFPETSFYATLLGENFPEYQDGMPMPTVSDGYWILLKPLPAGPHTLHIGANRQGGDWWTKFSVNIIYNITVTE